MNIKSLISELDNDPAISEVEFEGFLVWQSIRYLILQHCIDISSGLDSIAPVTKPPKFTLMKSLVYALLKNPFFGPKRPVLAFHTVTSDIQNDNGYYFNRIVDYFLEEDPAIWKIEEPKGFTHPTPMQYPSYSKLSLDVLTEGLYRLTLLFKKRQANLARTISRQLIRRITSKQSMTGILLDNDRLESQIAKSILKFKPNYYIYRQLYKVKQITKIIVEDGHYGGDKASIIKAAKDMGIVVFEPQHGFLNEKHPAYNYGSHIVGNKRYGSYVPDQLLSYGDFWAKLVNVPNNVYVLGNPHLEKSISNIQVHADRNKILVLGSGVTVKETNDLLAELLKYKTTDTVVSYRPHPIESASLTNRYGKQIDAGVIIDSEPLYKSLAEAKIVIGELTTALFEATALSKPVYLFHSSYTQAYLSPEFDVFESFTIEGVESMLNKTHQSNYPQDYFWCMGWQSQFKKLNAQYS